MYTYTYTYKYVYIGVAMDAQSSSSDCGKVDMCWSTFPSTMPKPVSNQSLSISLRARVLPQTLPRHFLLPSPPSLTPPPCVSSLSLLSHSHHSLFPHFLPFPPSLLSGVWILSDVLLMWTFTMCLSVCFSFPFLDPWGASTWDLGV